MPINIGDVTNPMTAQINPRTDHIICPFSTPLIPSNIEIGTNIGESIKILMNPVTKEATPAELVLFDIFSLHHIPPCFSNTNCVCVCVCGGGLDSLER